MRCECPLCGSSRPDWHVSTCAGCDDCYVPTLTDLARQAGIRGPDLDWLHALISDWQLLADLSFADLVLWAPLRRRAGEGVARQQRRRRQRRLAVTGRQCQRRAMPAVAGDGGGDEPAAPTAP